jgi:hypothetical protein
MYFYQWICVQQQILMLVYVCVSMFVSTCVSISLYFLVLHILFHYHCSYLCELVLEVSTLLKFVYVYDWPIMCTSNHPLYLFQYVWPYLCHLHYMYDWYFLWMYFLVYNSSSNLCVFVSNWTLPLNFFVSAFDSMSNSKKLCLRVSISLCA